MGILNNALLETHPEGKQGGIRIGYENSSSSLTSQHSELSFSILDIKVHITIIGQVLSYLGSRQIISLQVNVLDLTVTATPKDNMASLPLQGVSWWSIHLLQ